MSDREKKNDLGRNMKQDNVKEEIFFKKNDTSPLSFVAVLNERF